MGIIDWFQSLGQLEWIFLITVLITVAVALIALASTSLKVIPMFFSFIFKPSNILYLVIIFLAGLLLGLGIALWVV